MLKDQFPDLHDAFVAEGGDDEESFRLHLMALHVLPAGKSEIVSMIERMKAHFNELGSVVESAPFE